MRVAVDTAGGWTVKDITVEIRKGARKGWWQMRVGGKKFIVREVKSFFERGEDRGGKSGSKRGGRRG